MGLKNNIKNLISVLILVLPFNLMAQSPWIKKKKESYVQLSYTYRTTYDEVSGDPFYDTERKIGDNTLQLYSEYGFSNKTTLLLSIPLKFVSSGNLVNPTETPITIDDKITSIGNINIGAKHNFIDKKWLLTGQFNVEINTSRFDESSGLTTGFDTWTFSPLLITGTSFNKIYLLGFTGLEIRTNSYSNSFKLGGEIGYKPFRKMWITAFFDGLFSFENGEVIIPNSNLLTGLYINNQHYTAFGLKLINEINDKIGINLGIGRSFSAKNIGLGPTFTLGIYYK